MESKVIYYIFITVFFFSLIRLYFLGIYLDAQCMMYGFSICLFIKFLMNKHLCVLHIKGLQPVSQVYVAWKKFCQIMVSFFHLLNKLFFTAQSRDVFHQDKK